METQERSKRVMDVFSEKEKKLHVLTKFLLNQELFVKDSISGKEMAYLKKVNPEATKVLLHKVGGEPWKPGQPLILYKVLGRYVQLEATVELDKGENQYIAGLDKVSIAKKDRDKERFIVPPGIVWITNLVVSKAKIETDMFHIPMSVKVGFDDFQHKYKEKIPKTDSLVVSVFKETDNERIKAVKKTGKTLFLENVLLPENYTTSQSDDFLLLDSESDADVEETIQEFRQQGIRSELILPILYLSEETNESIPIGYIQWQSKSGAIDFGKALEIKAASLDMIERIRHSNMITIADRFAVLDISEGGLKAKIKHPDLDHSLPKIAGFNFDIFFKMQSPITCYGIIKSIRKDADESLIVGLALAGHSSRKGEKQRFVENVEYFQKNYTSDKLIP